MNTKSDFSQDKESYYKKYLLPNLRQLEKKRVTTCKKILLTILIFLTLFIISLASKSIILFIILTILLLIIIIYYRSVSENLNLEFKKKVIPKIATFFDSSLEYNHSGHISSKYFKESNLFFSSREWGKDICKIDRFTGEDHIQGNLDQTSFEFSEINAEYKTRRKKKNGRIEIKWHRLFKGFFFVADFNKNINGLTIILPDNWEGSIGGIAKIFQKLPAVSGTELINLENQKFEKLFKVYGYNQNEARYIITPKLMENLVAFKEKTGKDTYISFKGSNIYIALSHYPDMFETKIFSSYLEKNLVDNFFEDIDMACGIIQDLNLNRRIWTKS